MNWNQTQVGGNLTRDVELRYTPKGTAVADIGIAVNRKWKDDSGQTKEATTFVDVTLFGKTAEIVAQYKGKGDAVFIQGRLEMDTWEDKATGAKRSKLKVVAESVQFVGGCKKDQGERQQAPRATGPGRNMPGPSGQDKFDEEEDSIPF